MANSEQALQDEVGESPASTSFGAFGVDVDTAAVPALIGDEGGETPFSEYSLYFKMTFVCHGSRIGGGGYPVGYPWRGGVGLTAGGIHLSPSACRP